MIMDYIKTGLGAIGLSLGVIFVMNVVFAATIGTLYFWEWLLGG